MAINSFRNNYFFLSNFYPSIINLDGLLFPTLEHAYQASKTKNLRWRKIIQTTTTPGKAKRIGRKITLNPNWNLEKLEVMKDLIQQKFQPGTLIAQCLIDTSDILLEEGNTWNNTFWGVCNGKGENHLGLLLMEQRNRLIGII